MQRNYGNESTESEDELYRVLEASLHDVSLGSIKTQDSIVNNSIRVGVGNAEQNTELFFETIPMHNATVKTLEPFLSLKEAQFSIINALKANRTKLKVNKLKQIIGNLHKISEDFQTWKKSTDLNNIYR